MSTARIKLESVSTGQRCDGAYGACQVTNLRFFPRVGDAGVGHDFPLFADSLYHEQVIAFPQSVAECDVVRAGVIAEIA
jgi:hypothetical protein